MIKGFQAKDIQDFIGIPKHRYEYLITKIGIKPEILEVEGQGKKHLYSFKNVLQLAYAHHASELGFTPKSVRNMLRVMDNCNEEEWRIFDPESKNNISFYYIILRPLTYFKIKKGRLEMDVSTEGQPLKEYLADLQKKHQTGNRLTTIIEKPHLKWLFSGNVEKNVSSLKNVEGYVSINLSLIKESVNKQISINK